MHRLLVHKSFLKAFLKKEWAQNSRWWLFVGKKLLKCLLCLLWQPISHPAVRLSECGACFLISTFFLQTEKQTSVLFFCGWEAFKDYFADLVLTRLPRKKHKSPRHTPMWATFLTFQKVLKSVWAWGPRLIGWFLFRKFYFFNFYMVSSCSIWSLIFKTVFVFDVRPFLLLSVKFLGFNGNFNGKMTKINKMAKNHFSGV